MDEHSTKRRHCFAKCRFIAAFAAVSLLFGMFCGVIPSQAAGTNEKAGTKGKTAIGKRGEEVLLVPSGEAFGVRFSVKGALVIRVEEGSTAEKGGILPGDLILAIGNEELTDASSLPEMLEKWANKNVTLKIRRGGNEEELNIPLGLREERFGVSLRDMLAGIGTLTFYEPRSGRFAGLGHGICEGNGREVLPIFTGSITDVRITSVNKGFKGAPGQLRGLFCPGNKGSVTVNSKVGIFGKLHEMPDDKKAVPIASKDEVREGKAVILCTVADGAPKEYEVEIEKILSMDADEKNYLIRVTDRELLDCTGGIVQGMSGSPILQNGKLVGAVTHVLIEDPQRGYGIYIGNMTKRMNEMTE